MKLTNLTGGTVDLIAKGDPVDGQPPTASLGPRETADLNVDPENVHVKAMIEFGVLKAEGTKAAPKSKE